LLLGAIAAVIVAGALAVGLGLVVALGLSFTVFRTDRRMQVTLIALGVIMLFLALATFGGRGGSRLEQSTQGPESTLRVHTGDDFGKRDS
jgi:hypothetical protein